MKDKLKSIQDNKLLLEKKILEYEEKLKTISHKSTHQLQPFSKNKDPRTGSVNYKSGQSFIIQDDSGIGRKAFQNTSTSPGGQMYRECLYKPPVKHNINRLKQSSVGEPRRKTGTIFK